MKFKCRPVTTEFFQRAPVRFVNQVDLEASAAEVFAIFEDGQAWPRWFPNIVQVNWTSAKPYGVGTTRTVKLTGLTVAEYFFVWEPQQRFAFYFTETSLPIAKAFAEDYRLIPLENNRCQFIYTVCFQPTCLVRLGGPWLLKIYENLFRNASHALVGYIRAGRSG